MKGHLEESILADPHLGFSIFTVPQVRIQDIIGLIIIMEGEKG